MGAHGGGAAMFRQNELSGRVMSTVLTTVLTWRRRATMRGMAPRRATVEDYQRRLLAVQQLLEEKLDEALAPEQLAKAASFSLHHFHRIFRGQLGESVMQYVRRLRLE